MKETGALDKKRYYLHFERDLGLLWASWSKCGRGDVLGAVRDQDGPERLLTAEGKRGWHQVRVGAGLAGP